MARRPPLPPHRRANEPDSSAESADGSSQGSVPRWLLMLLGPILTMAVIAAVAGNQSPAVFQTFVFGIFVIALFLPAWMLGLFLTAPFAANHCFDDSPWPDGLRSLVAIALGLGAIALGTLLMGTIHAIEPGGDPWPLSLLPILAAAIGTGPTRRFLGAVDRTIFTGKAHRGEWLFLLAAIPAAMLLIAATFPPDSIWGPTEAGGYDVMEYHLQLPREYALNNSTAPLHHNVYSSFPSNIEMLYLILMQMAKSAMAGNRDTGYVWGTYPAQLCHACLLLLSAAALALMPFARSGKENEKTFLHATGRAIAVLVFLGIPWTIITGSLAYNEGGMLLFGTLAVGLALSNVKSPRHNGILIGLLLGLAVGCKMTAGVFFAIPVAIILLTRGIATRGHFHSLMTAILVAMAVYSPWALRAAIFSGGNPVFPIATNLLPKDGWSAEQSQRFNRGHSAPENLRSLAAHFQAIATCSLFDPQWSVQPYSVLHITEKPPVALDAWWKSLGPLWIAVVLALIAALLPGQGRAQVLLLLLMLTIQLLAWTFTTHLQSRFLLPIAIPLALLVGRGAQGLDLAHGVFIAALRIAGATIVVLHALATVFLLLPEAHLLGGMVTLSDQSRAPAPPPPIGELVGRLMNVSAAVENPQALQSADTPVTGKLLLLGDARAWRYEGPVQYYTVFDQDPFLDVLRANNPQQALHWLEQQDIRFILIDWSEVKRLRAAYGFDPPPSALTPEAISNLSQAGIEDTHLSSRSSLVILRVPERKP